MMEEFGFPWWSHLEEYASDPNRHFPGLMASKLYWLQNEYLEHQDGSSSIRWAAKSKQPAPTVRSVYERMWNDTQALSWFIVYQMLQGREGSSSDEAVSMARGEGASQDFGIAPRYTMELRVSVGGDGPEFKAVAAGGT